MRAARKGRAGRRGRAPGLPPPTRPRIPRRAPTAPRAPSPSRRARGRGRRGRGRSRWSCASSSGVDCLWFRGTATAPTLATAWTSATVRSEGDVRTATLSPLPTPRERRTRGESAHPLLKLAVGPLEPRRPSGRARPGRRPSASAASPGASVPGPRGLAQGSHGYFLKFGFLFWRKASLPSFASSVM